MPVALGGIKMDYLLTEEQVMIRDLCRQIAREKIAPVALEYDKTEKFPHDIMKILSESDLFAIFVPEEYGGTGGGVLDMSIATEELSRACGGIAVCYAASALGTYPIILFGNEEQKKKYLPPLAKGKTIAAFGIAEPEAGSDASAIKTTAVKKDDHYILNGTKHFITNGSEAGIYTVIAMTNASKGARGASAFILEKGMPGFTFGKKEDKMGIRASVTSELVLDDVRLPGDAVLPDVKGMKGPLSCLNEARFGILFGVIGAARSCYEAALDYAGTRIMFSKPIASFQLIQRQLVEMMVASNRGMLLALHLGRMKDAGKLTSSQISLGKLDNVRMALEVSRIARSVLGANGITLEYPVIRHMNNLESVYTYEGTNEIHTLIVGETLTGLRAYE